MSLAVPALLCAPLLKENLQTLQGMTVERVTVGDALLAAGWGGLCVGRQIASPMQMSDPLIVVFPFLCMQVFGFTHLSPNSRNVDCPPDI